ncbi:MAG: hypothetical protein RLY70_2991 [Planctomycetota bacterium]|jgi:hypothetical protein
MATAVRIPRLHGHKQTTRCDEAFSIECAMLVNDTERFRTQASLFGAASRHKPRALKIAARRWENGLAETMSGLEPTTNSATITLQKG